MSENRREISDAELRMGSAPLLKLMLVLSLPLVFSTTVQALYNIVDSIFVARYSDNALIALSIVFPVQLLMLAFATGTGVGVNALIAIMLGRGKPDDANNVARHGLFLSVVNAVIFTVVMYLLMPLYFSVSTSIPEVCAMGIGYTRIILIFSFGIFTESVCSRIMQATGRMTIPMIAQVVGAVINIVLDPILIFGLFGFPEAGVEGAAAATVIGQIAAMIISLYGVLKTKDVICVKASDYRGFRPQIPVIRQIMKMALPSIFMQALYTVYIFGLNLILAGFSESAVSVLGIYYKLQTFLIIPMQGISQATMPIMSYCYGAGFRKRLRNSLIYCFSLSMIFLVIGTYAFIFRPESLVRIFTDSPDVIDIGRSGIRIIGFSLIPFCGSMIFPYFFQAIGFGRSSMFLTVMRQIILMVPVAWIMSFFGLTYVWLTFPVSETVTCLTGILMLWYLRKRIIPNPVPGK